MKLNKSDHKYRISHRMLTNKVNSFMRKNWKLFCQEVWEAHIITQGQHSSYCKEASQLKMQSLKRESNEHLTKKWVGWASWKLWEYKIGIG